VSPSPSKERGRWFMERDSVPLELSFDSPLFKRGMGFEGAKPLQTT